VGEPWVPPRPQVPWFGVVIRVVVIAAAVAAFLPASALAQLQQERAVLMPGVSYTREVDFTPHGPVVVHVVTAPRPVGLYSLRPTLARNAVLARDRVTTMQKSFAGDGTSVAVNANLSGWTDGLIRGGVMDAPTVSTRATVGVAADGTLRVDRVISSGTWRGSGQRRPLALNQPPAPNTTTLYTRAWGATTPAGAAAVQAVLTPFPATTPNADLVGTVSDLHQGGGTPIPANGAVLVGLDAQAGKLAAEAPLGSRVVVRLDLAPDWTDVANAVGGGPVLVRGGRPVFDSGEAFTSAALALRQPRTAVGQTADGHLLLVVVDGRAGYSSGMTNFELALTMVRFGAVTASALDGGAAATLAFDGRVLNRPTGTGEPSVAEALLLTYAGVYAAPPGYDVVSPNGDGAGDVQTLSYRLTRAATVSAVVVAPDGSARPLDSGFRAAGEHPLTWEPASAAEGRWTFRVSAVDDQRRSSTAERPFDVNDTLGFLTVSPPDFQAPGRLAVGFRLARAARVTATVETRTGAVIRTLLSRRSLDAGQQGVAWNGRGARGRPAFGGPYVVRVVAANADGTAELQKPFTVRRR
jgi:hypothetical protein